jgi:hypothetical protein
MGIFLIPLAWYAATAAFTVAAGTAIVLKERWFPSKPRWGEFEPPQEDAPAQPKIVVNPRLITPEQDQAANNLRAAIQNELQNGPWPPQANNMQNLFIALSNATGPIVTGALHDLANIMWLNGLNSFNINWQQNMGWVPANQNDTNMLNARWQAIQAALTALRNAMI